MSEEKQQSPTIRQISAATGYSIATVSEALRDSPRVRQETRREIQEAAARLGYKKNPLVAALMTHIKQGRSPEYRPVIAMVTFAMRKMTNPLTAGIARGCHEQAERQGYRIEPFYIDRSLSLRRLNEILYVRSIASAVLVEGPYISVNLKDLDLSRLSLVALGRSFVSSKFHCVCPDYHQGMMTTMRNLKERGYKRIGLYVRQSRDAEARYRWSSAYSWFMEDQGLFDPQLLFQHLGPDRDEFLEWYDRTRPECIVTGLRQCVDWLTEAGYRIPEDVGVSFLGEPSEVEGPTYLDEHGERIGRFGVDMAIAQTARNERGIPQERKVQVVAGTWVEGNTTRGAELATTASES